MNTATSRSEYADLLARALSSVIHSEKENDRCWRCWRNWMAKANSRLPSTALGELLTLLIESFEEKAYALKPAKPIEILGELIEANGLKQKDLVECSERPSIVSEVLNGKHGLTIEHIIGSLVDGFMSRLKFSFSCQRSMENFLQGK